jgi:hypothetical protein
MLFQEGFADVLVHSLLEVLVGGHDLLPVNHECLFQQLVFLVPLGLLSQVEVLLVIIAIYN